MSGTTRAQFLARGTRGGLALIAGGSLLGLAEGSALGAVTADTDIAKLAATAELLAIDFYSHAIASKRLKGDELGYLIGARENERAHYAALKGVLGMAAPSGLKFTYPKGAFGSRKSIGMLGQALETAFVGAYMGAVVSLKSNDLKAVAAQIGASESRHLSVLTNIAAGSIVPAAMFDRMARCRDSLAPMVAATPFSSFDLSAVTAPR